MERFLICELLCRFSRGPSCDSRLCFQWLEEGEALSEHDVVSLLSVGSNGMEGYRVV